VPGVIRPRLMLLLPLAATLIAGCTSFSDNDAVARFEDVELSSGELTDLMAALSPQNVQSDPTNADAARETITTWVQIEAVKHRLDADGVLVSDAERDDATTQLASFITDFTELSDGLRDFLVDAQAAFIAFEGVAPPTDAELREVYERGPVNGNITCVAHILLATEDDADDVLAEFGAGVDFATLATERSIDPGSGAQGGVLACEPTDTFSVTYVAPFVEAALGAEIGVPTEPVESEFGYHVILVRPFDDARAELEVFFQPQDFALARAMEQADVYIDPRYGTLLSTRVVPLT
jgi:hypothetical protein